MANSCEICGKGVSSGHNVSHSNRKTKRRWLPNIHRVRAIIDGTPRRIRVCTNCLKSGRVKRSV